jgi:hypothetical protein
LQPDNGNAASFPASSKGFVEVAVREVQIATARRATKRAGKRQNFS